jgi:uncharacterized protein YukE
VSAQHIDVRLSALEASVEHLNGTYEQIDKRLGDLRAEMAAGFNRIDHRFEMIDHRFEMIDHRFEMIDHRFEMIDRRFETIDRRFEAMDQRFAGNDGRFQSVEDRLERNLKTMISWMLGQTAVIIGAIAGVAVALRH